MRRQLILALALLPISSALAQPAAPEEGISLTVYSSADPAGFDPQGYVRQIQ